MKLKPNGGRGFAWHFGNDKLTNEFHLWPTAAAAAAAAVAVAVAVAKNCQFYIKWKIIKTIKQNQRKLTDEIGGKQISLGYLNSKKGV